MKKLAVALAVLAGIVGAQAQTYPSRPITLIVPFPAGGSTDAVARIMAERMRPLLGQPVIIENVGGAGGSIAVGRVARAAPDGYTIEIGQWDTHVGNVIFPLTYDLQKDFEPIGLISINPVLIFGRKTLPADDLKGLVAWLKANPGKATLANQIAAAQVAGVLLQQLTDTQRSVRALPRRRSGHAGSRRGAHRPAGHPGGRRVCRRRAREPSRRSRTWLRDRSPAVPEIPTADEGGVPGLHIAGWFGFSPPRARRRTSSPSSMPRWCRRSPTRPCAPVRRARTRHRVARAADAAGARRVSQGRDREMVADHQGRRHQGGVKLFEHQADDEALNIRASVPNPAPTCSR